MQDALNTCKLGGIFNGKNNKKSITIGRNWAMWTTQQENCADKIIENGNKW